MNLIGKVILIIAFGAIYYGLSNNIPNSLVTSLIVAIILIAKGSTKAKEKSLYLLDLNAILDGRVLELASYKFIDGKILISKQFVDDLKSKLSSTNQTEKNTAKRGIRVIDELKKSKNLNIEIKSFPLSNLKTIEGLVHSAQINHCTIITTDFQTQKLAITKSVEVLNLTDLSKALRPIYLPGEEIKIFIAKEGRERNQGLGYFDDGTVVVVEEAKKLVGKRIDATVSSIYQTQSGKMIFAKSNE